MFLDDKHIASANSESVHSASGKDVTKKGLYTYAPEFGTLLMIASNRLSTKLRIYRPQRTRTKSSALVKDLRQLRSRKHTMV